MTSWVHNRGQHRILHGDGGFAAYSAATTLQAYDYTTNSASDFYPNPYAFTLNNTTNFTLSIPDYGSYGDESGGESLLVTQVGAVPEPGTTSLLAGGLLMAAGLKLRARRRATAVSSMSTGSIGCLYRGGASVK